MTTDQVPIPNEYRCPECGGELYFTTCDIDEPYIACVTVRGETEPPRRLRQNVLCVSCVSCEFIIEVQGVK